MRWVGSSVRARRMWAAASMAGKPSSLTASRSGAVNSSPPVRGAVAEPPAHDHLAARAVQLVPLVEVHVDAAHHHGGAAAQPRGRVRIRDPHVLALLALEVGGAVQLTELVAEGHGLRHLAGGVAEPVLRPADGGEVRGLLGEVARGVGHGGRVLATDLDGQVTAAPGVLQRVDGVRGELREPCRPPRLQPGPLEGTGPEPHRHGEARGVRREFRLGVGQARPAGGEA